METIIQKLPFIDSIIFVIIFFWIIAFVFYFVANRSTENVISAFVFGIMLILSGLFLFKNYYFIVAGMFFIVGSLLQRREWKKKLKIWHDFDKYEKVSMIILGILAIVLIIRAIIKSVMGA